MSDHRRELLAELERDVEILSRMVKTKKAKIEDIMCIAWIPTFNLEGYNEDYELDCLTIAGSAGGHVMVWKQNVIPPDSESDSEEVIICHPCLPARCESSSDESPSNQ